MGPETAYSLNDYDQRIEDTRYFSEVFRRYIEIPLSEYLTGFTENTSDNDCAADGTL